jgi:hypothetical protein
VCHSASTLLSALRDVAAEPTIAIAEPIGDLTCIALPHDVDMSVAVEVAGAGDVAAGRRIVSLGTGVFGEPAVGLTEPVDNIAGPSVGAQDVAPMTGAAPTMFRGCARVRRCIVSYARSLRSSRPVPQRDAEVAPVASNSL